MILEPERYRDYLEKEDFHWWWQTRRNYISDRLKEYDITGPTTRLLDVGCGAGGELTFLQEKVGMAVGIDYFHEALEVAKERGLNQLILASGNSLPVKGNSFDLIFSLDVLYHREIDELKSLKEIYRICKPGGYAVLSVAALDILRGREDITGHGARRYSKKRLTEVAITAGFEVLEIKYLFFTIFPIVLVFRLVSRAYRELFRVKVENLGTDVFKVPDFVNNVLIGLMKPEVVLSRYLSFPVGSSLLCILRKT